HTALNRLMMQTESLPDSEERGFLTVRKQYLRSLHPTRCFASRAGNSCQLFNIFIGHRQFDCLPPPCHAATPRSISTNEESTKGSPVPRPLVSWNRSSSIRGAPVTCQLMRCVVTEYKFRIGQLVYFHPKGIGRSHVDAGPGPYQIVRQLPTTDD